MTARIRPAEPAAIAEAARIVAAGGLVAFPTETVYGLGADAGNDRAVARIFEAKGRPRFNPLIVHFAAAEEAARAVVFDDRARRLAARFWPGPLTLVLPRAARSRISLLCSAGLDTLAVRVPGHRLAGELLAACGVPLAAPSANAFGKLSPTTAQHVAEQLDGRVDLILDGGPCPVGVESTVLDLTREPPALLRPGGLPREELAAAVGTIAEAAAEDAAPRSPGRLAGHYAPGLPLRLNVSGVQPDEALLAFGPRPLEGAAVTRNLSPAGDLREAAANLFAYLRELDRPGLVGIAAMPVPEEGLGLAINDRLRRAAAAGDHGAGAAGTSQNRSSPRRRSGSGKSR